MRNFSETVRKLSTGNEWVVVKRDLAEKGQLTLPFFHVMILLELAYFNIETVNKFSEDSDKKTPLEICFIVIAVYHSGLPVDNKLPMLPGYQVRTIYPSIVCISKLKCTIKDIVYS